MVIFVTLDLMFKEGNMLITKYNQSCLLFDIRGKKILVDPGTIGLTEDMINQEWCNIDIILVTHRHFDHCAVDAINAISKRDNAKVYTSGEVFEHTEVNNTKVVRAGDTFGVDDISIEVTKAVHGFLTGMKYNNGEIKENIGFIIDDGKNRVYVTSDTINFNHNYRCDILCMPFNGNGLTMGIKDGIQFALDLEPKLLLPIHMQHPVIEMNPDRQLLGEALSKNNINYKILSVGERIEV